MKFKIGDRVKGRYDSEYYEGSIVKITTDTVFVDRDDGTKSWECKIRSNGEVAGAHGMDDGVHTLELLDKTKTIMQKLTPMLKRALSKEWQTLYKANFVDGDIKFTDEGRGALESILLDQYKEQLIQLSQEQLDEEEKERKK